jgi:hypothetical protein
VAALVALVCCNDPYSSSDESPAPDASTNETGNGGGDTGTGSTDAADSGAVDARDPDAGCGHLRDAEFCDDFDQPNSLSPSTWTNFDDAGTISLADDDRISAPYSAHFVTSGNGDCGYLRAERVFPGERYIITARLSVRAKTPGTFLGMQSGPPSTAPRCDLEVGFADATTILLTRYTKSADGGVSTLNQEIALATSGFVTWLDVSLEFNGITRYATLRVGDQVTDVPMPSDFSLVNARVAIGPICSGDADLRIDDFAVFTRLP